MVFLRGVVVYRAIAVLAVVISLVVLLRDDSPQNKIELIVPISALYGSNPSHSDKLLKVRSGSFNSAKNVPSTKKTVKILPPYKIILMWNIWFPKLAENMLVSFGCAVTSCLFTGDLSLLDQSDIVFFNIHTVEDVPVMNRKPHQRFVFAQLESPDNTKPHLMNIDRFRYNFFNWTMTYRRDSDIFLRDYYGSIVNKATIHDINHAERYNMKLYNYSSSVDNTTDWTTELDSTTVAIIKGKTKIATWVVSHCSTPVRRDEYVRQLQQFMPVDVYGKCSKIPCPGSCDEMVRSDYKFYLSFENSWCPDYHTEKFTRGFMFDAVPVVLSGTDYSHFAPPHSYIDARDFASPEELASYLMKIDKSDHLYAQYFQWKKYYTVDVPDWRGWCDLCRMANDNSLPPKIYPDMKKWWYEDAGECESNTTKYF